jgi:hypothetical protein
MHQESPVVEVERLVLVGGDLLRGFFGHAVLDVHADVAGARRILDELPRREVAAAGAWRFRRVREVGVEALVLRLVAILGFEVVSKVPLAEVGGCIAGLPERLGERKVFTAEAGLANEAEVALDDTSFSASLCTLTGSWRRAPDSKPLGTLFLAFQVPSPQNQSLESFWSNFSLRMNLGSAPRAAAAKSRRLKTYFTSWLRPLYR